MPTFESIRASYRKLWDGMTVNANSVQAADIAAQRIIKGKDRYKEIERRTQVPWFFIGLCHMREGNFNFGTYLGNGQTLSRPTTIVPIGRGPFNSFEEGAVDALKHQGLVALPSWSLERIAFQLEGFNGYGYRAKGVNSPYLWSGTNRYTKGKYVADHVFDANAVDKQLGSMAVLSRLCAMDEEVNARVNGGVVEQPPPPDIEKPVTKPSKPSGGKTAAGIGTGAVVAGGGAIIASETHKRGASTEQIAIVVICTLAIAVAAFFIVRNWSKS